MSKNQLTVLEREERVTRRAKARAAASAKVEALREWRQARADAAAKRAAEAAQKRRDQQQRGVDRVPDRLLGLEVTVEPYAVGKRGTVLAQPDDLNPMGNYADRRARGVRGKKRKPRRRELPGAVHRRVERNRKAWAVQ